MKETCRKKRTTTMTSSGTRREDAWILNEQNTEAWLAKCKFESLEGIKQKMASDLLSGFRLTLNEDGTDERQYLMIFTYTSQNDLIPAMDNIIRISEDRSFIMNKHSNIIPKSKLQSILNHTDRFTRVSQVTNVLALLKNLQVSNTDQIETAEKVLQGLDLKTLPLEHQQLLSLRRCNLSCVSSQRITGGIPLTSSSSVPSSTAPAPRRKD